MRRTKRATQIPPRTSKATATLEITYEREWNLSDEFLPGYYKVLVSYDPDIRDDGNLNNDDCRETNNMAIRRASDINTLLD